MSQFDSQQGEEIMNVATFDPNGPVVTVTPAAVAYFAKNLAAETAKGHKLIRLSTKESGCTGYAYVLDLVAAAEPDDEQLVLSDAVTLAIAAEAVSLLRGTEIDMATEGLNHVVKFHNPNVVSECGCGESFSVA